MCIDPSELAEFVAARCGTLARTRVEDHIADCRECRALAFALADGPSTAAHRIGRFAIEGVIGSGAMGVVYRARDLELDRRVAIKVHAARTALEADGDERLRREAQALARLNHPNVVAVYEVGRHENDTFVAMELVDGVTLDEWMQQPHRADTIVSAFASAGRGLAAAHAAGLVHRDIKPRNVFVCATTGAIKIGDFGLVRTATRTRLVELPKDLTTTLSVDGAIIGTPAYMAPEQLRGEPATEASDQFSFCAMLFEAIYGVRPFSGATVHDLLAAMQHPPLVPASARPPSRRVRAVLQRGLSPDPGDRFPSMEALLDLLAPRRIARGPILALAGAALVGITAFAFTRHDPSSVCDAESPIASGVFAPARFDRIAEAFAATDAPRARDVAARITHEIDAYAARWRTTSVAVCRATTTGQQSALLGDRQRACLDRRLQRVDELLGVLANADKKTVERAFETTLALEPVEPCGQTAQLGDREPPPAMLAGTVGMLERTLDRVESMRRLGQLRPALDQVVPALAAARSIGYSPLLARALVTTASILGLQSGDLEKREALLEEALREAGRAHDDQLLADTYLDLVYLVGIDGSRLDAALQWAAAGEAAVLRAGNPPAERWRLTLNRAAVLGRKGMLDEAVREIEAALASRANENPSATLADAHNNIAGFLEAQGKSGQSHLEVALAMYRDAYGTDEHPDVIVAMMNLGLAHLERGELDVATAYLERARSAGEAVLGPEHVYIGTTLDSLGECELQRGHTAKSIELHQRAYAILGARLGPENPRTATALANLADALSQAGRHRKALDHFVDAIARLTATYGATHDRVTNVRIAYGIALRLAGQRAAARRELELAIANLAGASDPGLITDARTELAKL